MMSASQPFALDSVEATSIKELVEEIERSRHKARKIKVIFLGRFLFEYFDSNHLFIRID